jgi:hypothetical protein
VLPIARKSAKNELDQRLEGSVMPVLTNDEVLRSAEDELELIARTNGSTKRLLGVARYLLRELNRHQVLDDALRTIRVYSGYKANRRVKKPIKLKLRKHSHE